MMRPNIFHAPSCIGWSLDFSFVFEEDYNGIGQCRAGNCVMKFFIIEKLLVLSFVDKMCNVCENIISLCNFLPHVLDPQDSWSGSRRLCFAPCNCLFFNMIIIGYAVVCLPLLLPFWWIDWTLGVTVIIYLTLYCLWGSLPSTSAPLVNWYDYWSHSHLLNFVLFML
jgi:prepilin signal peptidase PulO-like enzyme (type II secretory pathway)